ncbi:hypothetical protein JCM11641_005297 [Rhodosporidiobolus odoratus]
MSMQNGQQWNWRAHLPQLGWTALVVVVPLSQLVPIYYYTRQVLCWQFIIDAVLAVLSFGGFNGIVSAFQNASFSDFKLQIGLGTGLPYLACIGLSLWVIWDDSMHTAPQLRGSGGGYNNMSGGSNSNYNSQGMMELGATRHSKRSRRGRREAEAFLEEAEEGLSRFDKAVSQKRAEAAKKLREAAAAV